MPASAAPAAPVLLVGAHGHGRWHLRNIDRLRRTGAPLRLAGICDLRPLEADQRELAGDALVGSRLDALLEAVAPEVTIVCTPIHTHADLALAAAAAGSHVLLEKPPTPTLAAFDQLVEDISATGRACQVGLQSLGSAAVSHVRALVADGAIGAVRGIGAAGAWIRDASYYARAPWAGRRVLDGVPVVDGALTNPFAHAVATALALDGTGTDDLRDVRVELHRANPIEADDTSYVRLTTARGTVVVVAATLCAERSAAPYVVVHGTRGRIVWPYKTGHVRLHADGRAAHETEHPTHDLLENLVAHGRDPAVPLSVPLSATRTFMHVVEAVRQAPEPAEIPAAHRRVDMSGPHPRVVLPGVDRAVDRAATELALFSELDLPWAVPTTAGPRG